MTRKLIKRIFIAALFCILITNVKAGKSPVDSLKKIASTVKTDTGRIRILIAVSSGFSYQNADSAIVYAYKALKLARRIKNQKLMALAMDEIGWNYSSKGEFKKARRYYFNALKIEEHRGNKKGTARFLAQIGTTYYGEGNYARALEYYFNALKTAEEIKDTERIIKIYSNIGLLYWNQEQYQKALDYYFKALKIVNKSGNTTLEAVFSGNIGNVYNSQKNYSKALEYYLRALAIDEMNGLKNGEATVTSNIGGIYLNMANDAKLKGNERKSDSLVEMALLFDKRALKLFEELGNKTGMAASMGNIGEVYLGYGKLEEAEKHLIKAMSIDEETGSLEGLKFRYKSISDLYNTKGNMGLAFEYYKKYINIRDSLNNDANHQKQARTEMQYEFDKKNIQRMELAKRQKLKYDEQIYRQRMYTLFGIVGFAFMMVVALVSWRAFRQKKKDNIIIARQKELVERKQKEVMDSIHYAKRIQRALLPSEKFVNRYLNKTKR